MRTGCNLSVVWVVRSLDGSQLSMALFFCLSWQCQASVALSHKAEQPGNNLEPTQLRRRLQKRLLPLSMCHNTQGTKHDAIAVTAQEQQVNTARTTNEVDLQCALPCCGYAILFFCREFELHAITPTVIEPMPKPPCRTGLRPTGS